MYYNIWMYLKYIAMMWNDLQVFQWFEWFECIAILDLKLFECIEMYCNTWCEWFEMWNLNVLHDIFYLLEYGSWSLQWSFIQ